LINIFVFLGIIGVSLIIIAYFLLQINKLSSNSLIFSLLNFFGSFLILISLFDEWNLPSFIIEIFWMLISLIGIIRALKKQLS